MLACFSFALQFKECKESEERKRGNFTDGIVSIALYPQLSFITPILKQR